jgi:hypothetical protein
MGSPAHRDDCREMERAYPTLSDDEQGRLEKLLDASERKPASCSGAMYAGVPKPDYIGQIYADAAAESVADQLARLRASIAESNAQRKLLAIRDIIRDVLATELECKVAAIALTRPGSRAMATPAEIVDLVNDLANNCAQALSDIDECEDDQRTQIDADQMWSRR